MTNDADREPASPKNFYGTISRSFCGMGGLGLEAERRLWKNGILCWNDYRRDGARFFSAAKHRQILDDLDRVEKICGQGPQAIKQLLKIFPPSCRGRFRPLILDRSLYLDIETTGLSPDDPITVLTLSDGTWRRTFVRGVDLEEAVPFFKRDSVFISFNGRRFDVPRLRRALNLSLRQARLDLRPTLKGLGFTGGQKRIESILGIRRTDDLGIRSGAETVRLWNDYQTGDDALRRLIQYNREDVIGLEKLFLFAYNESWKGYLF